MREASQVTGPPSLFGARQPVQAAVPMAEDGAARLRAASIDVLIVGVGNEALMDDGIGIHAARALVQLDLPQVRILEGGTDGLALLGRFEGVRRLVLIDAMAMGRPAGTIVTVRPEQLRSLAPADRMSLHGTGLLDVLELAEALALRPPEVNIVGVQPAQVTWGFELSPLLQQALPDVVEAALHASLGRAPEVAGEPHGAPRSPRAVS